MKIILFILIFSFSQIIFADVCDVEEPYGVSLLELESELSEDLSEKNYKKMYSKAEALSISKDIDDKISALLLLHKIKDNSLDAELLISSLVLMSKLRDRISLRLQFHQHYVCEESRAARDYVNRYPLGYDRAELWSGWFYEPDSFIEESAKGYTKEHKLKVKYLTYQEIDPCSPYEDKNLCYAPSFSEIADESKGMSFWEEALITAVILNLDLSVCQFALEDDRVFGLSNAKRHIQTLRVNFPMSKGLDKIESLLKLRKKNEYIQKQDKYKLNLTCTPPRTH